MGGPRGAAVSLMNVVEGDSTPRSLRVKKEDSVTEWGNFATRATVRGRFPKRQSEQTRGSDTVASAPSLNESPCSNVARCKCGAEN